MQDLRTSDYISKILAEMNFHGEYMPALAAVLSYILAYATTSVRVSLYSMYLFEITALRDVIQNNYGFTIIIIILTANKMKGFHGNQTPLYGCHF